MRKFIFVSSLVLVGILLLSGCKKTEVPVTNIPPPQIINATNFQAVFESASPAIKPVASAVMMSIQGSTYPQALNGLAALAANPALTEAQKKAVSDLTDQLQKKMATMQQPPK